MIPVSFSSILLCLGFLTYESEFVQFLAVLENPVLPHWQGQLSRDVKSDVRTLNFRSDVIFDYHEKTE